MAEKATTKVTTKVTTIRESIQSGQLTMCAFPFGDYNIPVQRLDLVSQVLPLYREADALAWIVCKAHVAADQSGSVNSNAVTLLPLQSVRAFARRLRQFMAMRLQWDVSLLAKLSMKEFMVRSGYEHRKRVRAFRLSRQAFYDTADGVRYYRVCKQADALEAKLRGVQSQLRKFDALVRESPHMHPNGVFNTNATSPIVGAADSVAADNGIPREHASFRGKVARIQALLERTRADMSRILIVKRQIERDCASVLEYRAAQAQLREWERMVGFTKLQDDIQSANLVTGSSFKNMGQKFEDKMLNVLVSCGSDNLLTRHRRELKSLPEFKTLSQEYCGGSIVFVKNFEVMRFNGEIDLMAVFVSPSLVCKHHNESCLWARVLHIYEIKRNADDLGHGFSTKVRALRFFTGCSSRDEKRISQNRSYPEGIFEGTAMTHNVHGVLPSPFTTIAFTSESFSMLRRYERQLFVPCLSFVVHAPKTIVGIHSSFSAAAIHALAASDIRVDLAHVIENSPMYEFLSKHLHKILLHLHDHPEFHSVLLLYEALGHVGNLFVIHDVVQHSP